MVASAPADQCEKSLQESKNIFFLAHFSAINDDDEDDDDGGGGGGGGGHGDEPTTPSLMDHGSDPRTRQHRDQLTTGVRDENPPMVNTSAVVLSREGPKSRDGYPGDPRKLARVRVNNFTEWT
ncbi:hypothetical protein E4U54_005704 [Claviceps lovelessii]|nr:hypothetical protein E4U54_005704 [Claviceps lovelessii]